MNANDRYTKITQTIIDALEKGSAEGWKIPWRFVQNTPINLVTGKSYRGINILTLAAESYKRGFEAREWLTFKQASKLGFSVRKGETSSMVVFFKPLQIADESVEATEDNPNPTVQIPFMQHSCVFNVQQLEGYTFEKTDLPSREFVPIEEAQRIICNSQANIEHVLGNRAFYSTFQDKIVLPQKHQFASEAEYYSVALHELTHWTGHDTRLNRSLENSFGSEAYAFEELVAEIGATFMCNHVGIEAQTMDSHTNYLKSWLKVLKNDNRAIFKAARLAQKASDFLLKVEYEFADNEESDCQVTKQAKAA